MINRKAEATLEVWKDSPYRKPLIIRGARQVGKTTLIDQFSKRFSYHIYLNLELEQDRVIFESPNDIRQIYQFICIRHGVPMEMKETLLFIDEIQSSPQAIKMLRFFYEELPELNVIAAGSLLEAVLLSAHISFPVGRVENLWLYPLDFEEFLAGFGMEELLEATEDIPVNTLLMAELHKYYRLYALLGGMPEIVARYIEKPDLILLNQLYKDLTVSYIDDVEKYAPGKKVSEAMRVILLRGFAEAGKRIKLEGFGNSNYNAATMKEAFSLLQRAQILKLCYPVTSAIMPIIPNLRRSPRLQFLDTGLINFQLGLQDEYFITNDLNSIYRGLLIQHLVGQQLLCLEYHGRGELFFWVREKRQASAEVDFLIPFRGKLIPIEVKSGKTGTLKSLFQYMLETDHDLAVRIYEGDFRMENCSLPNGKKFRLLNLPLALTGRILKYLDRYFS